jgi:catechol 2,3-dioxygenase-like lactoylglutathione lyase family enzyme
MEKGMIVEAVHHVCLVVRDMKASEAFYHELLGFKRHHTRSSWFVLNRDSTLHLVHIPEAAVDSSLYHEVQHFALQVPNIRDVLRLLLNASKEPFQMDFEGVSSPVRSADGPLSFGIGTLFVTDPDGNLVEFVQMGHGIYTEDTRPRVDD